MKDLLIFIVSTLATYRLSLMFSKELGPCRIFERIRGLFDPNGCWHKGISCILCESVWWAAIISFWLMITGRIPWDLVLIYWLGVSGLAVILTKYGPNLD